jgi:succinate dehydrogenase / fumarate reductase cytochrome b subunit
MNWVIKMFSSSIGQKFIMALTGLFLCSFLVVHMIGNLQLFKSDGGLSFNTYAVFMTTNPLIKVTSYLLYFSIVIHMKNFWFEYKFGHDVGYTSYFTNITTGETGNNAMSADYKQANKMEEAMVSSPEGQQFKVVIVKDLYKAVAVEFKEWYLVALYVLAMFALAFHLYHGFQSAFQSLGVNHSKYNGLIQFVGVWFFAIIVPASFAAMPLYFFFK